MLLYVLPLRVPMNELARYFITLTSLLILRKLYKYVYAILISIWRISFDNIIAQFS